MQSSTPNTDAVHVFPAHFLILLRFHLLTSSFFLYCRLEREVLGAHTRGRIAQFGFSY